MVDPRHASGRTAEDAATELLVRAGLRVVGRNVRFRAGEIDLVCRDGATWVFVEVKARHGAWGDPAAVAVTAPKRARLRQLAQLYLKSRGLGEPPCRLDVVDVTLTRDGEVVGLRHLRGAFDVEAW